MSLWSCWFGHADRVRERASDGTAQLVCPDCRHSISLMTVEDIKKGPQHHQQPVPGQPLIRAKRARFQGRVLPHSAGRTL
jgi:hypothetical protein